MVENDSHKIKKMDYDTKLKELKEKFDIEAQKLKLEFEIKENLKDLENYKIFTSELYKRVATVKFFDEFRSERAKLKDILKIVKILKPIKMFYNGSNLFKHYKETKDFKEINKYLLNYEGFEREYHLVYFTKIKDYVVEININCNQNLFRKLFYITSDYVEFKGGSKIENVKSHFVNLSYENHRVIKWAGGSGNYENNFTIWGHNVKFNFIKFLKEVEKLG